MKLPSPKDIQNFVEGYANYAVSSQLAPHIKEQVEFRAHLCSDCLANESCTVCKCRTPAMFYSPSKVDAKNKWGEFMTAAQWSSLKENYNLYKEYFDENNRRLHRADEGSLLSDGATHNDTQQSA
jgi:hypothetical protein